MIIDGHAHACGDFLRPEKIIEILDQNLVDQVVLVPGELNSAKNYRMPAVAQWFPDKDIVPWMNIFIKWIVRLTGTANAVHAGNAYVASLAQQYPERIFQFYWTLLSDLSWEQRLKQAWQQWQFKGVKLHQCWDTFDLRRTAFESLVNWTTEQQLPIFIHPGNWRDVQALIEFIPRHPEQIFIIGHLMGFERFIKAKISLKNLLFDISPPSLVSEERVRSAIEILGAEKLVLGSDTPYGQNNQAVNIARINRMALRDVGKRMILGENLGRILMRITHHA